MYDLAYQSNAFAFPHNFLFFKIFLAVSITRASFFSIKMRPRVTRAQLDTMVWVAQARWSRLAESCFLHTEPMAPQQPRIIEPIPFKPKQSLPRQAWWDRLEQVLRLGSSRPIILQVYEICCEDPIWYSRNARVLAHEEYGCRSTRGGLRCKFIYVLLEGKRREC